MKQIVLVVSIFCIWLPVAQAHTTEIAHSEVSAAVTTELESLTSTLKKSTLDETNPTGKVSATAAKSRESELVKVAKRRSVLMLDLAKQSPADFLKLTMSEKVRQQLPSLVQNEIEQQGMFTGTVEVIHEDDFKDASKSKFNYSLIEGAKKKTLYFSGEMFALSSGDKVTVSGYTLGGVTVAEAKTGIQITVKTVPESVGAQRTLVIPVTSPAVNNIKPYSRAQLHLMVFQGTFQDYFKEQSYGLVAFNGTTTDWLSIPATDYPSGSCGDIGITDSVVVSSLASRGINLENYQRVVFIFAGRDGGCSLIGKSTYNNAKVSQAWVGLTMDTIGTYALFANDVVVTTSFSSTPQEFAFIHCRWYAQKNPTAKVRCTWNGKQIYTSGAPSQWPAGLGYFSYVLAHELGHSLGVMHANALRCTGSNYVNNCIHSEYGNNFDVMGTGLQGTVGGVEFRGGHFNAYYKNYLGWLTGLAVKTTGISGPSTLAPLESAAGVRLLKITNPALSSSPLYVEYRRPIGFDRGLTTQSTGLFFNEVATVGGSLYDGATRLLNANQAGGGISAPPVLLPGAIFNDPQRGIKVTYQSGTLIGANLVTTISKPVCLRNIFNLSGLYTGTIQAVPGSNIVLQFRLENKDAISCGPSTLDISTGIAPDNGWASVFESPVVSTPNQLDYFNVTVGTIPLTALPGKYTLTTTVTDVANARKKFVTTVIEIATSTNVKVVSPNGGEKWELGTMNTVSWSPYTYLPAPINPVGDMVAYLEVASGNGYQVVGRIVEGGKASIHWQGEIDQYGRYPAPGQYYIRVLNTKTQLWDRSDAPFTILPRAVDLKVNKSNGPLAVANNQGISVSWTGTGLSACTLSGVRQTSGGTVVVDLPVRVMSTTTMFFADPTAVVSIACTRTTGGYAYDYVSLRNASSTTSARQAAVTATMSVTAPNKNETLMTGAPYSITWNQTGLAAGAVALYKDDKWVKWLNVHSDGDAYIWTPTIAEAALGKGAVFKIYITANKLDGTGYVDDKSDVPFSIASTETAALAPANSNPLSAQTVTNDNVLTRLLSSLKELVSALQLLP